MPVIDVKLYDRRMTEESVPKMKRSRTRSTSRAAQRRSTST